ncbi:hypothetical protein F2Q69_00020859 [Brassica cretica]|uniref:Uncharacterized protein n=1 Tax=Brassica cretica TaxID=69181 RepID=A0A8S9QCW0_BRACR|nr:hypothetical protein F2Q69_00020859 [Brassica cretica]
MLFSAEELCFFVANLVLRCSDLGFSVVGVAGGRLLPSGSFSIWRGVTGSFSVKKVRISEPGGTCCAVKCLVGLISLPAASGGFRRWWSRRSAFRVSLWLGVDVLWRIWFVIALAIALFRLQALGLALVESPPEDCPFFELSTLYGLRLNGCTRSRWNAMEAALELELGFYALIRSRVPVGSCRSRSIQGLRSLFSR